MTKEERIELLKAMHISIINIDDEMAYFHWITLGIPDEPEEYVFECIAEDDKKFFSVIKVFCNTVRDFS